MAERAHLRDLTNDEGRKLLAIVRRGSGWLLERQRIKQIALSRPVAQGSAVLDVVVVETGRVRGG